MIPARQFVPPPGTEHWLRELSNYLSKFAREWIRFPLSGGFVVSVNFVSGTVLVPHKLGRKPRGFVVLAPQDATYPYATAANWAARDENFLTLTAGASFTSDVLVF